MKIIFLFEWRQFLRQPAMFVSTVAFFLFGYYSIYNGKQIINKQYTAIDSLQNSYKADEQKILAKLYPDSTKKSIEEAKDAGRSIMINYRLPQNAINQPLGLSILSIGQRDIQPYYYKIKTSVNYMDNTNVEISNPAVLFAGNFDYAFLLIYLLPILILAFCFDVYSREKEMGTYQLLITQGMSVKQLIAYKLFFRLIIVCLLVGLLNIAGFVTAKSVNTGRAALWFLISFGYVFFWFSLSFAVISLRKSSVISAFYLLSGWLIFIIILPALFNTHLNATYSVPLRSSIASYDRETKEKIWNTKQQLLVDTFLMNNSAYKKYYNPVRDTASWGNFPLAAFYDLVERKVTNYASSFEQELNNREQAATQLNQFNPIISTQILLNTVAGTATEDHQQNVKQVHHFQKQWRDFLYFFQLRDVNLQPSDLKKFPVFKQNLNYFKALSVISGSLIMWLIGLAFIFIGTIIIKVK